jgi:hypothetical protein
MSGLLSLKPGKDAFPVRVIAKNGSISWYFEDGTQVRKETKEEAIRRYGFLKDSGQTP